MVYVTGDLHGQFGRVKYFAREAETSYKDTLVVLGDVGLNYNLNTVDWYRKRDAASIPVTMLCVHGNHEARPTKKMRYQEKEFAGGTVLYEPEFPSLLFAVDGEIYRLNGKQCLVIGGAYSVDKMYRLASGAKWFPDEQPSEKIKEKVERVLYERDYRVDMVLSHTCPIQYIPTEVFLPMIDQKTVDNSTERWLGEIEEQLDYDRWWCGHYHTEKTIDKMRFLYGSVRELR